MNDFEARRGCGIIPLALLAAAAVLVIVLARKYGWAR